MVCLAPRAPGDSVRPRRLSGVVVRPLNFTVRGPAWARRSSQQLRLASWADSVLPISLVGISRASFPPALRPHVRWFAAPLAELL